MPTTLVARAGGWTNTETLTRLYQKAEPEKTFLVSQPVEEAEKVG